MTDYASLVQAKPDDAHGVSVGYGDWRLCVEALLPSNAVSAWAPSDTPIGADIRTTWADSSGSSPRWGSWGSLEWVDLTDYVRGIEWTRGSDEFDGRPQVGVATITLDNSDGFPFSPIDPQNSFRSIVRGAHLDRIANGYFRPGTLIRIAAASATGYGPIDDDTAGPGEALTDWVPQFTGIVESWPEVRDQLEQESWVDIVAVETVSLLARVDENALTSVVGHGDTIYQRVQRLADAAGWQFGYAFADLDPAAEWESWALQSTNMAQNRLAEIYLSGDSVGVLVFADRSGALMVGTTRDAPSEHRIGWHTGVGPFEHRDVYFWAAREHTFWAEQLNVDVVPRSLTYDNDDEPIINVAQYAIVGSIALTAQDRPSIRRYGRRTTARSDLLLTDPNRAFNLASALVSRRRDLTLRVRSLDLDNLTGPTSAAALITVDVKNLINLVSRTANDDQVRWFSINIDAMTHRVTPVTPELLHWTATYQCGHFEFQQPVYIET